MRLLKFAAIPAALCLLSPGVSAVEAEQAAANNVPATSWQVGEIEAGSNLAPGSQTSGKTMDDAFDVHTLVAGEWY